MKKTKTNSNVKKPKENQQNEESFVQVPRVPKEERVKLMKSVHKTESKFDSLVQRIIRWFDKDE